MNELFSNPWWLTLGVPALAALAALWPWAEARRRRTLARFAELRLIEPMLPPETDRLRLMRAGARLAALLFLLVALAGPRWGVEVISGEEFGIQVVVAVDTSASMLSEDVKPSRIERATRALSNLVDGLQGNRVGIVAFAGMAAIQCPLTTDTAAARLFLRALRPDMLPLRGTAVGEAVRLGTRMLSPYPGTKGLVLITDGEDHGSDPPAAAREAAAAGVRIYAIGMGSPDGEPIPIRDAGGTVTGYKRDAKGDIVVSRLGEKALEETARLTGGAYYRTTTGEMEISDIVDRLKTLDRSRLSSGARERFRDRTQLPLTLALALLLLELSLPLWPRRKDTPPSPSPLPEGEGVNRGFLSPRETGRPVPGGQVRVTLLVALLLLAAPASASVDGLLRRGNRLLDRERYEEALESYKKAREAAPSDPRAAFNEGIALYRLGRFDEAAASFEQSAKDAPETLRRDALYNAGNARFRAGALDQAVSGYRGAILLDPADADARHNLQIALKRLQKQQNQPKDDKNKKPNDQKQKDQESKPRRRPQGSSGLSREDAKRILEALREKEKSDFDPRQYDRAGKAAKPDTPAGAEDW